MQTSYPEQINPATLFSRERRRRRMRQFLETFEGCPQPRAPENRVLLLVPKDDLREPRFATTAEPQP